MATTRRLQLVTSTVLVAAILLSGWFEQYAKGSKASYSFDGFSVWVAAPFVLMLIAVVLAHSTKAQTGVLVTSLLLALAGLLLYWDAMFVHTDAQGGLVFLFIPLYQYIAVVITIGVVIYARMRARWRLTAQLRGTRARSARAPHCER
jgi:hypothetical protein